MRNIPENAGGLAGMLLAMKSLEGTIAKEKAVEDLVNGKITFTLSSVQVCVQNTGFVFYVKTHAAQSYDSDILLLKSFLLILPNIFLLASYALEKQCSVIP